MELQVDMIQLIMAFAGLVVLMLPVIFAFIKKLKYKWVILMTMVIGGIIGMYNPIIPSVLWSTTVTLIISSKEK